MMRKFIPIFFFAVALQAAPPIVLPGANTNDTWTGAFWNQNSNAQKAISGINSYHGGTVFDWNVLPSDVAKNTNGFLGGREFLYPGLYMVEGGNTNEQYNFNSTATGKNTNTVLRVRDFADSPTVSWLWDGTHISATAAGGGTNGSATNAVTTITGGGAVRSNGVAFAPANTASNAFGFGIENSGQNFTFRLLWNSNLLGDASAFVGATNGNHYGGLTVTGATATVTIQSTGMPANIMQSLADRFRILAGAGLFDFNTNGGLGVPGVITSSNQVFIGGSAPMLRMGGGNGPLVLQYTGDEALLTWQMGASNIYRFKTNGLLIVPGGIQTSGEVMFLAGATLRNTNWANTNGQLGLLVAMANGVVTPVMWSTNAPTSYYLTPAFGAKSMATNETGLEVIDATIGVARGIAETMYKAHFNQAGLLTWTSGTNVSDNGFRTNYSVSVVSNVWTLWQGGTNGVKVMEVIGTNVVTLNGITGNLVGDGAGLTNLNAANIASGTLSDARLSGNVALLNGQNNFTGSNNFSTNINVAKTNFAGYFVGDGSGLTGITAGQIPNLDASKITTGTIADARLSSDVARTNNGVVTQIIAGSNKTSNGPVTFAAAGFSTVALSGSTVTYTGTQSGESNTVLTADSGASSGVGNPVSLIAVPSKNGATNLFRSITFSGSGVSGVTTNGTNINVSLSGGGSGIATISGKGTNTFLTSTNPSVPALTILATNDVQAVSITNSNGDELFSLTNNTGLGILTTDDVRARQRVYIQDGGSIGDFGSIAYNTGGDGFYFAAAGDTLLVNISQSGEIIAQGTVSGSAVSGHSLTAAAGGGDPGALLLRDSIGDAALFYFDGTDVVLNMGFHAAGKITSDTGLDPAYVLYDAQTRAGIKAMVLAEVPGPKQTGAAQYFNKANHRIEYFVASENKFFDLATNKEVAGPSAVELKAARDGLTAVKVQRKAKAQAEATARAAKEDVRRKLLIDQINKNKKAAPTISPQPGSSTTQ